jgi:Protein of unknown function (DUF3667)/Domain of unknown function (DUF4286)
VLLNDDNETVIYEVSLEADAAIEGPFDTWLRDHIADMLQLDGFLSAEILVDKSAPTGRIRRIVQYRLRNEAALDRYLREHAPVMRQHGIDLFGDRFTAGRRTLAHREEFIRGAVSTENCLNCGEVLTGQHCSHCGQRARVRVLSLGGLLRDLFGDMIDFDSRIWRTLFPLAFRPGQLTAEYLRGRRTYYTPPFRMYLTLSVVFFLATSIGANPGDDIKFDIDPNGSANLKLSEGDTTTPGTGQVKAGQAGKATTSPPSAAGASDASRPAETARTAAKPNPPTPVKLDPERQKLVDTIVDRVAEKDRARARKELEQEFAKLTPGQVAPIKRVVDDPCGGDNIRLDIGPMGQKWLPKAQDACRKIVADSKGFGRAVYQNIPKMMFIFLPLIAAVMFVLYLGSGRYYVEHLLFFVHYHAFFFLAGLAIVLLERGATLFGDTSLGHGLDRLGKFLTVVLVFYVPYYLFRAMRRVYAQGRFVTVVKYSMLVVGYVFFMALTVMGLLAYTALTL